MEGVGISLFIIWRQETKLPSILTAWPSTYSLLKHYHSMPNSAKDNWYFLIIPQKIVINISCKLSPQETVCMKCQWLFSGEKKYKNFSKWCLRNILPSILSTDWIICKSLLYLSSTYKISASYLMKRLGYPDNSCFFYYYFFFVFSVQILCPSQSNRVMSSAVSLPNFY